MKTQIRNFLSVYFLSVLVVAGTISFLAGPALAEVVTFNFTGTITNVGDPVTGSITYDTSLPPAYDTGSIAGYIQPPPSGMSVVIGGSTIQSSGDASLQVLNNSSGVDNFSGYFSQISVNGQNQPSGSMFFNLGDTSQRVFSSTALPDTLRVKSFNIRSGSISAGSNTVSFSIDTLLAVGKHCTTRPLSDFLNAQGTSTQFFPPVKDYVGWVDGNLITFALVDYAGLAYEYINELNGPSLGTTMRGSITQCTLRDGRAQVTVVLFTTKALGFAQSIAALVGNNFDFLNTPTIFGAKAQDVVNSEGEAAVGPVSLVTSFCISSPSANLPDFLDVVNSPTQYAPANLNFRSTTFGLCSNGKKARLDVHQVAHTTHTNDQNEWVYSVEKVKVVDVDGGNCD